MPSASRRSLVSQRVADRLRLAARNVEAAAGEVFGLLRGERQREDHDEDPGASTQRRRRPRNPASRIISSRIGWSASLAQRAASGL